MGRVESPASFSASPPPFPIHSSPKETRWRGKSYETELPFPSEGGSFPFPARSVAQSRHRTESATYWGGRGSSAPRSPPHAAAPPSRAREKEGARPSEGGLGTTNGPAAGTKPSGHSRAVGWAPSSSQATGLAASGAGGGEQCGENRAGLKRPSFGAGTSRARLARTAAQAGPSGRLLHRGRLWKQPPLEQMVPRLQAQISAEVSVGACRAAAGRGGSCPGVSGRFPSSSRVLLPARRRGGREGLLPGGSTA